MAVARRKHDKGGPRRAKLLAAVVAKVLWLFWGLKLAVTRVWGLPEPYKTYLSSDQDSEKI